MSCFSNLRKELTQARPYQREYIVHLLMGMILTAARICGSEGKDSEGRESSCYSTVCRMMIYIKEHFQEDLSRDRLAKKYGLSPSYLSRVFKEYSGVCLQNYIVQCRVQRAISLLKQGNISVLDAALESGFTSMSGFYRAFHDVTGKRPKDVWKAEE
ncbi:MAG: helix-turn-helix transcriptional regulator [Clostridia bacterium]|nr:helix-turn-helix transcriptional regulator [Clostridia bacterium]